MKTTSKIVALAVAAAALNASAAFAATSLNSTASALVVGPLAITETQALSFGSFAAGSTAGTVDQYSNTTGGVTKVTLGQPAIFHITGNPNAAFQLVVPANVSLASAAAGSTPMVATFDPYSPANLTASVVYDAVITAKLAVAANQVAGGYTGTYNVYVHY